MNQRPSIIVADTDSQFRNLLRLELIDLGFEPLLAFNGDEAFRFAESQVVRLAILDTSLPDFGAYNTCLRMRRLPHYGAVPILLMTRLNEPRIRAAAIRAGISALLLKPFSVSDLIDELERYLVDESDPRAVAAWRQSTSGFSHGRRAAEPPAQSLYPRSRA